MTVVMDASRRLVVRARHAYVRRPSVVRLFVRSLISRQRQSLAASNVHSLHSGEFRSRLITLVIANTPC